MERSFLVVVHRSYSEGKGSAALVRVSATDESAAKDRVLAMLTDEMESLQAMGSLNMPRFRVEYVISQGLAVYDGYTLGYLDLDTL